MPWVEGLGFRCFGFLRPIGFKILGLRVRTTTIARSAHYQGHSPCFCSLRLQIAQSRYHLWALGPKVCATFILGVSGVAAAATADPQMQQQPPPPPSPPS